ncbi:MAG: hypothetical protein K1W31_19320 [Lachnospiraceae bacterium]
MTKNKQLAINIAASMFAFAVSAGINFFLSPFIVENVGEEAYGFVNLSNNIISYFAIVTIALNSMASRFIAVSYFKNDIEEASEYYSSNFFANLAICLVFAPIFAAGIINVHWLNISPALVTDVQLLMAFIAISFILDLLATNLGVSYYVKNRLYISSLISIGGYLIKVILLLFFFGSFATHIAYVGFATLTVNIFIQGNHLIQKRRLLPELKIKHCYFKLNKIRQLIAAGIWNSITRVGGILQDGLDLLITNLMISPSEMGILAISKTIPTLVNNLIGTMVSSFIPNMTELYASNETETLKQTVKQAMKIIGMLIDLPIALFIGFGDVFFQLWVPSQDAKLLQILSILAITPWAVMGQATIIHNIFTIVNKIKINSLLVCMTGFLNVFTVYILLKNTGGGLFVVAGVSSVYSILRNVLYTVPCGAIYIRCPWYTFFPEIGKSILAVTVISGISVLLKGFMPEITWLCLFLFAVFAGMIGLILNFYLVLNGEDREFCIAAIRKWLRRLRENENS